MGEVNDKFKSNMLKNIYLLKSLFSAKKHEKNNYIKMTFAFLTKNEKENKNTTTQKALNKSADP